MTNESESHTKHELMTQVFPGWGSIVDGVSVVRIHAVVAAPVDTGSTVVLAHWETDYDVKAGSVWYGTDVDISGKKVRGFLVFACFTLNADGQIRRIVQRSDTVVKSMGIEDAVRESRQRLSLEAGQP